MIVKPALAAMLASGLIVPEKPALVFPKPAIVKAENLEFTKHLLLGMPMTMGMLPGKAHAARAVTYQGSYNGGASSTTKTYTDAPIGTAAADRLVVVVVTLPYSTTSTGTTAAGNAMTLAASYVNAAAGRSVYIYSRVVTTGTTATIVNTTAASINIYPMFVYTVNLGSTSATPSDTDILNASGVTSASFPAVTVPTGGVYIAGLIGGNSDPLTWTGATLGASLPALTGRGSVASGKTAGSVTVSISGLTTSRSYGGAIAVW